MVALHRITAHWRLLTAFAPPRSSHTLVPLPSAISASETSEQGRLLIYGGEARPREPADISPGSGWLLSLPPASLTSSTQQTPVKQLNASSASSGEGKAPAPRVGAAAVEYGGKVWVCGGRRRAEMVPIPQTGWWTAMVEEDGDRKEKVVPGSLRWDYVESVNPNEAPEARSYHAITSINDTLYVHAGCLKKGRVGDLYSFNVQTRAWKKLASAPGPERGGTVLAPLRLPSGEHVLARWGGFAGYELGADDALDLYSPSSNSWTTVYPRPKGSTAPGPRSVHALVPYSSMAHPSVVALMIMGEKAPSNQGHAGAGEFWDDVWALFYHGEGDAQVAMGGSTNKGNGGGEREAGGESGRKDAIEGGRWEWEEVELTGEKPEGRGWFAAAVTAGSKGSGLGSRVVVHGGLVKSNERKGEVWELRLE